MMLRIAPLMVLLTLLLCAVEPYAGEIPPFSCELKVKERFQYYDIYGSTIEELRSQMKSKGVKGADGKVYTGLTTWDIRYVYDIGSANGRYSISSATTRVDIVYRMPRFATSDPQLAEMWQQYLQNLQQHEFGHKALAVNAAAEINEIFASIPAFPDADLLAEEVTRRTEEKFKRLKTIQVDYDHETRHGETQGAILPDAPRTRLAGA